MLRTTLVATIALFCATLPAKAEEHYILMTGSDYFPNYLLLNPGDTLRFINVSSDPMSAVAVDDSWDSGDLEPGGEFVLPVWQGMKTVFENKSAVGNGDGRPSVTTIARGEIGFMAPSTEQAGLAPTLSAPMPTFLQRVTR